MQISAANSSGVRPIERKASTEATSEASSEASPSASDDVDLRRVAALLSMLENNPEIRPEILARGRALASDVTYPPPDIINKLANLIVARIS